jgi:hypothetical protein
MKELGFDLDTIADVLGQETAGMAAWYAPDAQLERKFSGVVEAIDAICFDGVSFGICAAPR